jgi:hypothetical protein
MNPGNARRIRASAARLIGESHFILLSAMVINNEARMTTAIVK